MLLLRIFYRGFGLAAKICPLPLPIPLPFKQLCFKTPSVPLLYSFWCSWFILLPGQGKDAVTSTVSPIKRNVQECLYYVFYYLRL